MLYVTCFAACCNFEICLMACPQNAHLDETVVPWCDSSTEESMDDNEEPLLVVEEQDEGK